jgi:DNA-binding CsgD family transcriptional regulator
MTRPAAMVPVEREIVRWCHSGLDVSALQRQVLRSLRRVMTVEAAFFATADPETLLFTGAYVEEPLESATPMFLANEFGSDDVNKFAALATSATRVGTLDNATHHVRPSSPRSRDIMQPLGLGDELRAALVAGSECWGYLCLHRDDSGLGFTSAEAALLARLGPHIAHALRQALLLRHPAPPGDATAPGVIVMTEDFSPVAVTAEAEHLLSRITDGRSAGLPLPLAVYSVALALHTARGDATAAPPSTRVRTAEGSWVALHASFLPSGDGRPQIAVVVEPVGGRPTLDLLLAAYGLSAREMQVARLVLRGASTRTIVTTLRISQHTVQDHLKSVFAKTGVRSRRELVGRLLAPGS